MRKKYIILLALLLSGCQSDHKTSRNAQTSPQASTLQSFYDSHLFFDLDTEAERYECKIQGEIPEWLSGTLLRNGPAKFTVGEKRVNWFDGLAMLHAFEFSPEQVLYSNKFIRSKQYYIMMKEKSLNFSGFAQDPCPKVFKNQLSMYIPKEMRDIQNADVTIQDYADKMVALTEVPLPVVFDPKTVDTLGAFEYADDLPKSQIWESAHAQHNLEAGETYNYLIDFGATSHYVIWKMKDHSAAREVVNKIPVKEPAYMHSFALTQNYQILVAFPFVVNPIDLIEKKKPFIFNYKWKPELGTQFYVTDLKTGKLVATIKGDPFFAFHHVNAFDKDGTIYMDICTFKNPDIIGVIAETITENKKIEESQLTKLERFTIDVASQTLSREVIFDKIVEMPRVPASRTAHEYNFAYLVDYSFPSSIDSIRPLYKINVTNKSVQKWAEPGSFPGEPIFVPKPGSKNEDDGVVLSLVLDLPKKESFLLILDAKDMSELARAYAPHPVPVGLHGLWKMGQ